MNTYYILEQLHQLVHKCAKWKKVTTFTQFEQKNTHISGCKLVYKYTIAIVIVQICTITVACACNILIIFSLSSLFDSHLPLSQAHNSLISSIFLPLAFADCHRRQWERGWASWVAGRVYCLRHEWSSQTSPLPRISWVLIHFWLSLRLLW